MRKLKGKNKIHVKSGDIVQVISGKYKNQIGSVIKVIPRKSQVVIKDLNLKTKHIRPKREEESGQISRLESAIHSSNVMLYSTKNQTSSRYRYTYEEAKKCRQLIKTQEIIK